MNGHKIVLCSGKGVQTHLCYIHPRFVPAYKKATSERPFADQLRIWFKRDFGVDLDFRTAEGLRSAKATLIGASENEFSLNPGSLYDRAGVIRDWVSAHLREEYYD